MYEFDWSSIVPSMPYLLDGIVLPNQRGIGEGDPRFARHG
jgi:hypothetical protein